MHNLTPYELYQLDKYGNIVGTDQVDDTPEVLIDYAVTDTLNEISLTKH